MLGTFGPLPAAKVVGFGLTASSTLATAHAEGVLHQAMSPENLLIDADGLIKVSDFGTAAALAALNNPTESCNEHVAPEVVAGGSPTAAADVYALGSTLYTLLEGRSPLRRTRRELLSTIDRRKLGGEQPKPMTHGDDALLRGLIQDAINPDPLQRPTAVALARHLASLHLAAPFTAEEGPPPPRVGDQVVLPFFAAQVKEADAAAAASPELDSAPMFSSNVAILAGQRLRRERQRNARIAAAVASAAVLLILVAVARRPDSDGSSALSIPARASTTTVTATSLVASAGPAPKQSAATGTTSTSSTSTSSTSTSSTSTTTAADNRLFTPTTDRTGVPPVTVAATAPTVTAPVPTPSATTVATTQTPPPTTSPIAGNTPPVPSQPTITQPPAATAPSTPPPTLVPVVAPPNVGNISVRVLGGGQASFIAPGADRCADSRWQVSGPVSFAQSSGWVDAPAGCWAAAHQFDTAWGNYPALVPGRYTVTLSLRKGSLTNSSSATFDVA